MCVCVCLCMCVCGGSGVFRVCQCVSVSTYICFSFINVPIIPTTVQNQSAFLSASVLSLINMHGRVHCGEHNLAGIVHNSLQERKQGKSVRVFFVLQCCSDLDVSRLFSSVMPPRNNIECVVTTRYDLRCVRTSSSAYC